MLFLLFQLGNDRYLLNTMQVAQVLPLIGVKQIPLMPAGVAGALNYGGKPLPVIDLNQLAVGRPAARKLSTRIVLVNYHGQNGVRKLLGLIAEKATELVRYEPDEFTDPGITNPETPYLGPVVSDAAGLMQWVDPDKLLPASITEKLFTQLDEQAAQPEA